jgi:hypothetical protein
MNTTLNELLVKLEDFNELKEIEQSQIQSEILDYADNNSKVFIEKISSIKPSSESVSFEIYEALAQQPEKWNDFLVSEFIRIQKLTETATKKDRTSISECLTSFSFIARKEYSGNEKLLKVVMDGTNSSSKEIVLTSIQLLGDIYGIDKTKYQECKMRLLECQESQDRKIAKFANEILIEFDGVTKDTKKFGSIFNRIANIFSK